MSNEAGLRNEQRRVRVKLLVTIMNTPTLFILQDEINKEISRRVGGIENE